MNNRLTLTLKELRDLVSKVESWDVVQDELKGNAGDNPDFVTLHIVRLDPEEPLIIKVIH